MEIGKENEGEIEKLASNSLVSSLGVLRKDIDKLLDFIKRLNSGRVRTSLKELTLELTFVSAFCHLHYSFFLESCNDEMSCISNEIHDLVQSLFHPSGEDMLVNRKVYHLLENIISYISSHSYAEPSRVTTMTEDRFTELLDVILMYLQCCSESIFPSMTQYELLLNVFGNLRDFHRLKANGCVEYETIEYVLPHLQLMALRVVNFCCLTLVDEPDVSLVNSKLGNLLVEVIPVELEVMHICCTNLKGSKSEEVELFIKQLVEASPDILRESLIHLQEQMVINAVTPRASTCNFHVMIEFLLIILTDVLKDIIRHDKLFVLLARVIELTKEVFVLVRNIEENMNEASDANLNLLENIELLKEDLKNDFFKARADSSQLCFPMSDGPLFMTLLLINLNDLANSNASSVALIKEEIKQVKEDLEIIRSFFGYVEQELHRDLWTRVLDVAYEAEHAINSILSQDHGLLQLIFILPDTVEKIKLVKREVQEKIPKSRGIIVANAPNKPVVRNSSSTVGKIIVGFEEETEWIIRKLTSGPAEIDVISIVGMPGIGKTTLAYRVYNHKSIVDHFDVCAWCTVDQERNEKKLLQKIFNQVIGLKEFSENDIDDKVGDKLRKQLFAKRYLIVLDDMWDTATLDELTRPFPELRKGSRVILTSRKKEVALHGQCHSDPLYLQLLRSEESWELLEKRVFGEERCPDELKDVGEKIARKCDGLPLVLDLIGGVISRKEKKEALWHEVLNNLSSFIFKDEEEVVKVIQLSYDHLSDHVKPCLVYLASYPKDRDIRIFELEDLWISQGLVEQIEMKSAEEVVDELISSSLIIPFDNSICKIHDLVHDFCYIKSRKEKLLHFIDGSKAPSSSSSSSDLMPRGIIICFDKYTFRLNENFVVFNPEKKNPYVKHLLSLKACMLCLPHKSHLKHLRLLKSLDLKDITLKDSLLNEIGMLVHLKYLIIQTRAKALPPSFSNLCNLETLMVDNVEGSYMILSPCLWSLAKLRDVRMNGGALFDPDITVLDEDSRLENLRTLSELYLPARLEDMEDIIFKRFPNLQNLEVCIGQLPDCSAEKICFPRLDVLNELEQLCLSASSWDSFPEYTHGFPLSLKIMRLQWLSLTSDTLSRIARLPNLQVLFLVDTIIEEGKEWNMEDVTFQNLKYLKLDSVEFSEWQVDAEKSFPMLEMLDISSCDKLMEIPDSFGDIASLELIKVWFCPQLKEMIFNIKEYVEEINGEDKLEVDFYA
ncbi:putative late blight resistance protein homolog R1A-3 [Solanum stenotomum]|uniref:putative late blight resistance protein homolog R1A-3 n=1 Tax=Solanum stenotomum TaxID=172797 RepID=UPI0020D06DB9|nr:putative late blight resistance protein homolog R1A-3 [Solanum stenotomum]